MAYDTYGNYCVNVEGRKPTYSACIADFTPAASATDIITITGATNKTITITNIRFSGSATASTYQGMYLFKRSSLDSGGTSTPTTMVPHDSKDILPSAVVYQYSANPSTLGTSVGLIRNDHLALPAAGGASNIPSSSLVIWDFCDRSAKGIKLQSSTEQLGISLNGMTVPAGINLHITIEWTEEITSVT